MKTLIILAMLVMLGGCSIPDKSTPPVTKSMTVVTDDTTHSLLQLAAWLAPYGIEVIREGDAPTWKSAYPTDGTTARWFKWRVETMVPAGGLPAEDAAGLFSSLRVLTQPDHRDSLKVWTACVDSAGVQGDWSQCGLF